MEQVKVGATTTEQLYRIMGPPDYTCRPPAETKSNCFLYVLPNYRVVTYSLVNDVVSQSEIRDDEHSIEQHKERVELAKTVAVASVAVAVIAVAAAAGSRASSGSGTLVQGSAIGEGFSGDVIESHIDGTFNGWTGDSVFVFDNGQIWQQTSYAYLYHYAYHPRVIVYRDGGQYRLKVENVEATIAVKRLK